MNLPSMKLKEIQIPVPIIQGGMGVGVSDYKLAGSVAREGGMGCLSSAGLDRIVSKRHNLQQRMGPREASAQDVRDAKKIANGQGAIAMNIMVATFGQYEQSVLGSMDGGVDAIISGAGLPMQLPEIVATHPRANEVALIPIASSGRAFELICRRWQRQNRLPDAVIVEGPLAGGHIAWRKEVETYAPENKLENLIAEVLEVAKKFGNIPVIAAGGIYTYEDICQWIDRGCVGVQIGTRFVATEESGANDSYKQAVVNATKEDIVLASEPGSPCGLLFRTLKTAPFYQQALRRERRPNCSKGYVLNKGNCPAKVENEKSFCICNGLMASINMEERELDLYTVGENAWRVDRVMSVKDLMYELTHPTSK